MAKDDWQSPRTGETYGVIMLCHGSQRGASREECSCAWAAYSNPMHYSSESAAIPEKAGIQNSPSFHPQPVEGPDPDWHGWCRRCPSTPVGLAEASRRLQSALDADIEEGQADVLMSCLEFIQPHPPQAVELLAARGRKDVVVMPYLLGHGRHATEELDEVLEEARQLSPGVKLRLTSGFGADPRLADLVVDRVHDLDGTPGLTPAPEHTVGVLVVKAGTKTQYDDCIWLRDLGQMVEKQLGAGYAVDVAQSHYGDPTMEYATANLVEGRGVSALVCVPYLFFPGMILKRNVLGGMRAAQEKYPHIPMHVTPPLGVDDRVVAVAADRIREACNQ